jgi:radical SAM protein with 4Fe4S-binding SPASM domain
LISVEACDAARFSMFVSEEMRAWPCSFMAELCQGHAVTNNTLQEIWQKGSLFVQMRRTLSPARCGRCSASRHCMSGCPLFPEINICSCEIKQTSVRTAMRKTGGNSAQDSHDAPLGQT